MGTCPPSELHWGIWQALKGPVVLPAPSSTCFSHTHPSQSPLTVTPHNHPSQSPLSHPSHSPLIVTPHTFLQVVSHLVLKGTVVSSCPSSSVHWEEGALGLGVLYIVGRRKGGGGGGGKGRRGEGRGGEGRGGEGRGGSSAHQSRPPPTLELGLSELHYKTNGTLCY